jgi:hypothetical protein
MSPFAEMVATRAILAVVIVFVWSDRNLVTQSPMARESSEDEVTAMTLAAGK